jgi:hypothetical protein
MRIGAFEMKEPLPELNSPHAIARLWPWIDVGAVGAMTLKRLELVSGAEEAGRLARPGNFFDFTRYRPSTRIQNDVREVTIPNSTITCARNRGGVDFVFLNLLEPHANGEEYTASVSQVLQRLGASRYILIGSMYDMTPHTRPLLISGGSNNADTMKILHKVGVRTSNYEGPTSICTLISQEAQKAGVESMTLLVHLPQYTEFEEDYMGLLAILSVMQALYGMPVDEDDVQRARKQSVSIDAAVQKNRKVKGMLAGLENYYDTRLASGGNQGLAPLSPEVEQFLNEMEDKFEDQ